MTQENLLTNYRNDLLGVFGDPSLVLVSGRGSRVTDTDGKVYLDLLGGISVNALGHGFHGRTIGALSLTWKPAYREPFEPLPTGIKHIPATLEALEENLTDDVAALIVEPVQGEAGVLPLLAGYLTRARELTREKGALLIVDEVQTDMGRTGRWSEHSREPTGENLPDAITLAKGLGSKIHRQRPGRPNRPHRPGPDHHRRRTSGVHRCLPSDSG